MKPTLDRAKAEAACTLIGAASTSSEVVDIALPAVVLGRRRLIHVAALERWAAEQAGLSGATPPAGGHLGSNVA